MLNRGVQKGQRAATNETRLWFGYQTGQRLLILAFIYISWPQICVTCSPPLLVTRDRLGYTGTPPFSRLRASWYRVPSNFVGAVTSVSLRSDNADVVCVEPFGRHRTGNVRSHYTFQLSSKDILLPKAFTSFSLNSSLVLWTHWYMLDRRTWMRRFNTYEDKMTVAERLFFFTSYNIDYLRINTNINIVR